MRCNRTTNLEVHHIRRDGGNSIGNAEVLCHDCHVNTSTYGKDGVSPEPFSDATKREAKSKARYKCECTRNSCRHH